MVRLETHKKSQELEWHDFIEKFAGCLANDPIERGAQGENMKFGRTWSELSVSFFCHIFSLIKQLQLIILR